MKRSLSSSWHWHLTCFCNDINLKKNTHLALNKNWSISHSSKRQQNSWHIYVLGLGGGGIYRHFQHFTSYIVNIRPNGKEEQLNKPVKPMSLVGVWKPKYHFKEVTALKMMLHIQLHSDMEWTCLSYIPLHFTATRTICKLLDVFSDEKLILTLK